MIELSNYNPQWPGLFNEEKQALKESLGSMIAYIEHIGSTAIPNIKTKPIIDMMVAVKNLQSFSSDDIKKVEHLGYKYHSVFESEFPNRRYFQKNNSEGVRTHQIHLVNHPSSWFEKHTLFRDYLIQNKKEAKRYENLKAILAQKYNDTISYAKAKSQFCHEINEKAYFDFSIHKPEAKSDFNETESLNVDKSLAFIRGFSSQKLYEILLKNKKFSDVLANVNMYKEEGYYRALLYALTSAVHYERAFNQNEFLSIFGKQFGVSRMDTLKGAVELKKWIATGGQKPEVKGMNEGKVGDILKSYMKFLEPEKERKLNYFSQLTK